jgi:hypothetical protein
MEPKLKAEQLFQLYLPFVESLGNIEEIKNRCKQCALIAVDEILETTKVKWATQRKFPNGEYKFWKGVAYKKYWQEVKQEIPNL